VVRRSLSPLRGTTLFFPVAPSLRSVSSLILFFLKCTFCMSVCRCLLFFEVEDVSFGCKLRCRFFIFLVFLFNVHTNPFPLRYGPSLLPLLPLVGTRPCSVSLSWCCLQLTLLPSLFLRFSGYHRLFLLSTPSLTVRRSAYFL